MDGVAGDFGCRLSGTTFFHLGDGGIKFCPLPQIASPDDIVAALEDHGFETVEFILGPTLP